MMNITLVELVSMINDPNLCDFCSINDGADLYWSDLWLCDACARSEGFLVSWTRFVVWLGVLVIGFGVMCGVLLWLKS